MKKSYLSVSIILILALVIYSCKKDSSNNPPSNAGRILGTVTLYDDRTTALTPEGMTVTIDGTAFTAVTNASGQFSFDNVPNDTYNLTYSKADYGIFKLKGFVHTGTASSSALVPGKTLGKISTTTVSTIAVTTNVDSVFLTATISPAATGASTRGVRFFYSTQSSISGTNYQTYSPVYTVRSATGSIRIAKSDLLAAGLLSGATIYVRAYGDAYFSNDYDDAATGKTIFPNLNQTAAAAVSFTL